MSHSSQTWSSLLAFLIRDRATDDVARRVQALADVRQLVEENIRSDRNFAEAWDLNRFTEIVKSLETQINLNLPSGARDAQNIAFLASQVRLVRCVTMFPSFKSQALPESIYLFGIADDTQIATMLNSGILPQTIDLMQQAVNAETLDPALVAALPLVTNTDGLLGVYFHFGNPQELDGPNKLPPQTIVTYTGSGTSSSRSTRNGAYETGLANRVWIYHLNQKFRLRNVSQHYLAFYGTSKDASPKVILPPPGDKRYQPDQISSYRKLFYFPLHYPKVLVLIAEALSALTLRTFDSRCKEVDLALRSAGESYKRGDWIGTNRGWPMEDNTAAYSSAAQSLKGQKGSVASANSKRNKNADALMQGTAEITYIGGAKDSYINIPSFEQSTRKLYMSTPFLNKHYPALSGAKTDGKLKFVPGVKGSPWTFQFLDKASVVLFSVGSGDIHNRKSSIFSKTGFEAVKELAGNLAKYAAKDSSTISSSRSVHAIPSPNGKAKHA